ncbi:MAG: amidohydrolase family protein [Chloroflexi bacterium]|nr:amidohydrolase family protein [Chloroflexota bacterium]
MAAQRTVFRGGLIFDGTGAQASSGDLVVEGGRIVDLGGGSDGDISVDCAGMTLLPGLFDCHTHVMFSHIDQWKQIQTPFSYQFYEAAGNLAATLGVGITTIRDAGGADLGVKRALEDGLIGGPRMHISIRMLSQTGGHGDDWYVSGVEVPFMVAHPGAPSGMVDGPDAMRVKVRQMIRAGADVIKVATSGGVLSPRDDPRHAHLRPAELEILVAEAEAAGVFVMAHAQAADGIKNAVRAGIRSIEHGIYLDDEAIELMLEHGTWLVPTLVAPGGVIDAAAQGVPVPEASVAKARQVVDIHQRSFSKAVAAGVRIAMGTDSGVTPHGSNLRELALMADGGMEPAQVLAAATSSAAELMGLSDRLGTLEPGKLADVVLVRGDVADLATLSERIESVYMEGRLVSGTPPGDGVRS